MSNHDRENPPAAGGDSALDRAWQQASDEQPSPQLDAAILAAARKSVQEGARHDRLVRAHSRSRNWLTRWQPMAAAAAVASLAFVLVQSLPREPTVAPPLRVEPSAPVPAATAEKVHSPVTGEASKPAPGSTSGTANEYDMQAGVDRMDALRTTEPAQRSVATSKRATGVAAPEAATATTSESMQADSAPLSTAEQSANIAALFAAGEFTGAADALRAFRAADPQADTYLPESLRDWARTVR